MGLPISIKAEFDEDKTLLIEVKKTQNPIGALEIENFRDKIKTFTSLHPKRKTSAVFWSFGGFTAEAKKLCEDHHIGMAIEPKLG